MRERAVQVFFRWKRKTQIIIVSSLRSLPFNCRTNIVVIAENENNLRAAAYSHDSLSLRFEEEC